MKSIYSPHESQPTRPPANTAEHGYRSPRPNNDKSVNAENPLGKLRYDLKRDLDTNNTSDFSPTQLRIRSHAMPSHRSAASGPESIPMSPHLRSNFSEDAKSQLERDRCSCPIKVSIGTSANNNLLRSAKKSQRKDAEAFY